MKKINYLYFIVGMMLFAVSCVAPDEWHDRYDQSIVPAPVSNVQVENVNGGAIINYTLPSDPAYQKDLMGAKVAYQLTTDGELMERYASAEKDTIILEGFGDTEERIVTIYVVHKNGNVSEGVTVTIHPLTPPIFLIRESMQVKSTFGGIMVTWDNPMRKDMGISLYVEDSITHEMVLFDKYFSRAADGRNTFRPFEPEEQNFLIEVFDRWQNFAPDLETTLTPLEEVQIMPRDANGMDIWKLVDGDAPMTINTLQRYMYRGDMHTFNDGQTFQRMIANEYSLNLAYFWYPSLAAANIRYYFPGVDLGGRDGSFPLYLTIDMGVKAIYNRFLIRHYDRQPTYSAAVWTEFAIWGTNSIKAIEDVEDPHEIYPKGSREANQAYWTSWKIDNVINGTDAWKNDGWVKILHQYYETETGYTTYFENMPLSANDIAKYRTIGYEFEFNMDVVESYRYLRFEIISNCGNYPALRGIHYMKFWGSYQKDE